MKPLALAAAGLWLAYQAVSINSPVSITNLSITNAPTVPSLEALSPERSTDWTP